jgi:hypothetical protein
MSTPLIRDSGTPVTLTTANAIANNAYANSADAMRLEISALSAAYLLADFCLTGATFGTAPSGGSVQLIAVDRTPSGTQGPTPSASLLGRVAGTFNPVPSTSNVLTTWTMTINAVPLSADCDYWLYNNGTGYTIASGCTLTATPWSPGT